MKSIILPYNQELVKASHLAHSVKHSSSRCKQTHLQNGGCRDNYLFLKSDKRAFFVPWDVGGANERLTLNLV